MEVNILMSAYNGEKFIAEQIKSIQQQTFTDWQLIIRDDGSHDKTCEIIDSFVKNDNRITLVKAENVGVIKSFYELVKKYPADFSFFSDQDDFWLPDKLQIMLDETKKHDNSKPIMYYTDLKVVDKNLTVLSKSMIRSQSDHANTELVQELTENTVTGCTSMINAALAKEWQDTENIIMHDWYLALVATALGELVYIDRATILYRQHDNNVLGSRTLSKRVKNWTNHWLDKYWWLIDSSQVQAKKLLSFEHLSPQKRSLITDYVSLLEQPLGKRRKILKRNNLRKNKTLHTFIFKTLIITKFAYKK
ncbi:glycosyltransferase family 2 protein [Lactococcus nasutitermitis]|uniref:Glycosyltransferase family 2 protein n=1 Tax=Lactococcus nasutitermitis TaxID=1652957 RepID=A0ABV9JHU0_9LACT|nr:glycosyltransferase family 2 protein [Lactococcus nasutitermitis]